MAKLNHKDALWIHISNIHDVEMEELSDPVTLTLVEVS
jgi:ribosomal protein L20A (L18A)